ncbi:MAG: hypothetical protein KGL35_30285 [Bradyrhizobium sp.]|nr:hypothetical protein [Bradyrhizobium sp.]
MTALLDGYLYGYQWLANVFLGTLTPRSAPANFGPFTNISYRIVEPLDSELDQLDIGEMDAAIVQAFELWNITIAGSPANVAAGGYHAKPGDQFIGAGGAASDTWNVKLANSDPIVSSTRIHPTTRIVCTKQL